jgi:hypothetical protein
MKAAAVKPATRNRTGSAPSRRSAYERNKGNRIGVLDFAYATLRAFVDVFRTVRGLFRDAAVDFLALVAASTAGGNSSFFCFAVRWWPWRSG